MKVRHSTTYLIGLDLGTSAIKGVLTDGQGHILAECGVDTSFLLPRDGWVEVDAEQHYRNVCGVIRELTASASGEVAARAMGVTTPGQMMLSCGTSWVGFVPCMNRQTILDAGLLCDPFLSVQGGPWSGIFSVPQIGRTIDWYVDNLIAPAEKERLRIFDDSAAQAAPGAGGLKIDLRQPPQRLQADRANISRAVMEGAARLLHEKIMSLQEHGFKYKDAVMVGGPAKSPIWPQIVAEITGLEVTVGNRSAGARGAAMLAGQGIGLLPELNRERQNQSASLPDGPAN